MIENPHRPQSPLTKDGNPSPAAMKAAKFIVMGFEDVLAKHGIEPQEGDSSDALVRAAALLIDSKTLLPTYQAMTEALFAQMPPETVARVSGQIAG